MLALLVLGLAATGRGIWLAARHLHTAPSWLSLGAALQLTVALSAPASRSAAAPLLVCVLTTFSIGLFFLAGQMRREFIAAAEAEDEAQVEHLFLEARTHQLSLRLRGRPPRRSTRPSS